MRVIANLSYKRSMISKPQVKQAIIATASTVIRKSMLNPLRMSFHERLRHPEITLQTRCIALSIAGLHLMELMRGG